MSETLASHIQLIQHAVAAAKAGNPSVAKIQLQKAAEEAPGDPAIWLWMGWLADSPASAAQCLELARSDGRFEKVAVAGIEFAKALAEFQLDQYSESVPAAIEAATTEVAENVAEQNSPQLDPVEAVEEVVAAVESLQQEDAIEPAVVEVEEPTTETISEEESVESTLGSEPVCDAATVEQPAVDEHHEVLGESLDAAVQDAETVQEQPSVNQSGEDVEAELMQSANELWQVADEPGNSTVSVAEVAADAPAVDQELWQPESEEVALAPVTNESTQAIDKPATPVAEEASELIADESEDDFSFAADDDVEFGAAVPRDVQPSPGSGSIDHPQNIGDQWLGQQAADSPQGPVWRKAQSDWFSVDSPPEPQPDDLYSSTDSNESADAATVDSVSAQQDSSLTIEHQPSSAASTDSQAVEILDITPTADEKSKPAIPRVTASDVWQSAAIEKSALTAAPSAQVPPYQPMAVQPQTFANPESGALTGATPQPPVVTSVPASTNLFTADSVVEQSATGGPANAQSLDQKTVLVVDDSPTVRKLVAITLEKRGYKVVSAFDGVAAIKEIAAHNPSLILMDVNMPRLDGYQLCKLVKKHESTRDIPVLMLTGKDGMFDRLRGRLVGCAGSIAKPFSPEELLEVVEQNIVQAK